MHRILLVLASAATALVLVSGAALALPAETPDNTPMVDGPVRAIEQVGGNVWVGGNFSRVEQRNGNLLDSVRGLAVFDSETGQYKDIAPSLSGNVRDIDVYYGTHIAIAGNFAGPSSSQKNLVVLDGATGEVVRWYNSPVLQSVLAAPSKGRIYGGGVSLSAFEYAGVKPLWTRAKATVDDSLRPHKTAPGYRDLKLDPDGNTIWAACACDAITGQPAKALARLNTDGAYDASWRVSSAGGPSLEFSQGFGISLVQTADSLYLGAGGNDFLAQYRKSDGLRMWVRDTSGSVQAVEVMDGQLMIGGHFWEVADQQGDQCGFRLDSDPSKLDPNDECHTRHGLAAYSFGGTLDPGWDPDVSGKYNLAWALQPDELHPERLHFGGEFTRVDGVRQTYYARLSEPGAAQASAPVVQAPTQDLTTTGSTLPASAVQVKVAWSATDEEGVSSYELQRSTNGGATYKNVSLSTPTTSSKTFSLNPGGDYSFRVRAMDNLGNLSSWVEGERFRIEVNQQQSTGVLEFAGSWAEQALSTAFEGTTMHSSEAGTKATRTFTGTDVSWVAQKAPNGGKAEVWLDGTKVKTVDLYASSAKPRKVMYNNASLDSGGSHTLEVKVLGTKRAASSGARVDVDAFVALSPLQ